MPKPAEIIPYEPDTGNAGAGKSRSSCLWYSLYTGDMVIVINNQRIELPQHATLKDALAKIEMAGKKGIAAAVNSSVVSKSDWDTFNLQDNDTVLVIKAAQGG